ncbi:GGDEF domain-containing protein [Acidobacteriia bacterium AH_259_A11_L15]|nr:GGDEF domain-containing protein [Acidobacteriia bacterium AH_259_A11_L15]
MLDVIKKTNTIVGLSLQGQEFLSDPDSGEVIIPKKFLTGFRLSEIPEELVIKPVEAIENSVIHIEKDISISRFHSGSASVHVEDMGRRKLWDGEVGFAKFMEAMRHAVKERHETIGEVGESDFQDDGDYIFLWYEIRISQDMPIEAALEYVGKVITKLEERRDQILSRRLDPLLGIFDRGTFDTDLAQTLEVASAMHRSLSLILLDIDHFKVINDAYGHPTGDAVLKAVAQILGTRVEGKGEAYRYGGEELAALLIGASSLEAVRVAEEIRCKVEESKFEAGVRLTVSCGVASYPADSGTTKDLITAADTALRGAKQAGRNLVRAAGS